MPNISAAMPKKVSFFIFGRNFDKRGYTFQIVKLPHFPLFQILHFPMPSSGNNEVLMSNFNMDTVIRTQTGNCDHQSVNIETTVLYRMQNIVKT